VLLVTVLVGIVGAFAMSAATSRGRDHLAMTNVTTSAAGIQPGGVLRASRRYGRTSAGGGATTRTGTPKA
jgi:hypothetical protein